MIRVLHVIIGLDFGGAEAMLYKLVCATRRGRLSHVVASLTDGGGYRERLAGEGVPVVSLGMRRGVPDPIAVARFARVLRRERPDVVQGWMYHANLLAASATIFTRIPVVWSIHHADVDPRNVTRLTSVTRSVGARLSGVVPARIICCANAVLRSHAAVGYREDRMVVIPNGFDVHRFAPDPGARADIRHELSIPADAPVVGLVARVHPDKDHRTFLLTAAEVARRRPDAVFVLAGQGVDSSNPALSAPLDSLGLRPRVRLLGVRGDLPRVLSAIDVLASSSRTEAFPQVLGEAMLCGVPCAVTDCGDSAEIVGATGRVVMPGDAPALAGAVLDLLALPPDARATLGADARRRIVERFDIRTISDRYAALYEEVCAA